MENDEKLLAIYFTRRIYLEESPFWGRGGTLDKSLKVKLQDLSTYLSWVWTLYSLTLFSGLSKLTQVYTRQQNYPDYVPHTVQVHSWTPNIAGTLYRIPAQVAEVPYCPLECGCTRSVVCPCSSPSFQRFLCPSLLVSPSLWSLSSAPWVCKESSWKVDDFHDGGMALVNLNFNEFCTATF